MSWSRPLWCDPIPNRNREFAIASDESDRDFSPADDPETPFHAQLTLSALTVVLLGVLMEIHVQPPVTARKGGIPLSYVRNEQCPGYDALVSRPIREENCGY